MFWVVALGIVAAIFVLALVGNRTDAIIEAFDSAILKAISTVRTPWMTRLAKALSTLGSQNLNLVLRWGTILALIYFRRWRQLIVFVGVVLVLGWVGTVLPVLVSRPRPLDILILGNWAGFSMPSAPVAAISATLLGMGFVLFPDGKWKIRWFWGTDVLVAVLALSRMYLAVDHPTDALFGAALGMGLTVLGFRVFCPEEVFPVTYQKSRSAHLDIGGARGDAIKTAVGEQIGLEVLEVKPFGLSGSGGSTPMRLTVVDENGVELHVFAKLYAATHLRSDRNYKLTRAVLYGRLEDEKPFSSVRQLVQFEDYLLRVMRDAGINVAKTYGFVEITPEREYILVTEFLEGGVEISEAAVDQNVIDSALMIIRKLWDAGLAHRDIKPANILVIEGRAHIIDVAFAEIRPSPWRQAIDLANMMLVLGLYAEPRVVYERALRLFTPTDLGEAFAATRGVASPTQLKNEIKKSRPDLLNEFRAMAPAFPPVEIQRWSIRRIALTSFVGTMILLALLLILGNLRGAGLLP